MSLFIVHLFKRKYSFWWKKEVDDTGPDIFWLSLFHFILTFSAQQRGRSGWQVSHLSGPHSFIIGYKLSTRILLKTRIGGARRIIDQGASEGDTLRNSYREKAQTAANSNLWSISLCGFFSDPFLLTLTLYNVSSPFLHHWQRKIYLKRNTQWKKKEKLILQ